MSGTMMLLRAVLFWGLFIIGSAFAVSIVDGEIAPVLGLAGSILSFCLAALCLPGRVSREK